MAHVLALSDIGELYSWGANSYGQIGVGNTLNTSVPNLINSVEDRQVILHCSIARTFTVTFTVRIKYTYMLPQILGTWH